MKLPSVIIPTKSVFVELCSKNTLSTKISSIFDSISKIGTYSKSFFQNGINILSASAVVRNNQSHRGCQYSSVPQGKKPLPEQIHRLLKLLVLLANQRITIIVHY